MEKNMDQVHQSARVFLRSRSVGVLSTQHIFNDGLYPYGSMCPYMVNLDGQLAIYISDIALHTKNILKDNKVGFTVMDIDESNQQAAGRISLIGTAKIIDEQDSSYRLVKELYQGHFPASKGYHKTHGFNFCLIRPEKVHYIQTFGRIYTFSGDKLLQALPEWAEGHQSVIDHMNDDHQEALINYCRYFLKSQPHHVKLVSVDSEGFNLRFDQKIHYIPFESKVEDSLAMRKSFVAMSKQARQALTPAEESLL